MVYTIDQIKAIVIPIAEKYHLPAILYSTNWGALWWLVGRVSTSHQ